jgi:8-oxo-dGTP pyrophosphatase MutT (NUDIX family)
MSDDLPPWDSEDKARARPRWIRRGEDNVVFENPWLRLETCEVTAPTGHPAVYGVVRMANLAIGVLPVFDDGTVMLVGQARFALSNYSWEMPEGGAPMDEAPIDGARRELREETGLDAAYLEEVLRMELSNSVTDERAICYLATGLTEGQVAPDETEQIEHARVPFRQLLDAIEKGQVRDALTVATALRVYHMAVEGRLPSHLRDAILAG